MASERVWYDVELSCPGCAVVVRAHFYSYGLSPFVNDVSIAIGQSLAIEVGDLEIAFGRLRPADAAGREHALETWGCPRCGAPLYALLTFVPAGSDGYRLTSVETFAVTLEALECVELVSFRAIDTFRHFSHPENTDILAVLDVAASKE